VVGGANAKPGQPVKVITAQTPTPTS